MADVTQAMDGRVHLLQAANELFANQSFNDVPVSGILAHAGVKAPTLYHHFGDKEGLYVAWAEGAFATLSEQLKAAISGADPLQSMSNFAESVANFQGLNLLTVLGCTNQLSRAESREAIERSFLDSVYEPACMVLLNAVDAGHLRLEPIGAMVGVFLMGALTLGPSNRLPIGAGDARPGGGWIILLEVFELLFDPLRERRQTCKLVA